MKQLCIAAFIIVVAAQLVAARRGFKCEQETAWNNRTSAANDPVDCVGNADHLIPLYQQTEDLRVMWVAFAIIPAAIFVLTCVCYPYIICFRYCCRCCGSYKRRPSTFCCGGAQDDELSTEEKDALYPRSSIRNTKVCAVVLAVLAVGSAIVLLNGSTTLLNSYYALFEAILELINWVQGKSQDVRLVMTKEDGTLIPPLNESFFTGIGNLTENMKNEILDVQNNNEQYIEYVIIVAICFAILPLVSIVGTAFCGMCDIRKGCLCCNSCCHCLFTVLFGVVGFIFMFLGVLLQDVCAERDAFIAREPGIGTLYLVPLCNETLPFADFEKDISAAVIDNSRAACGSLLDMCDPVTFWSDGETKMYYCGPLTDSYSQCTNLSDVTYMTENVVVKTGAPLLCTNSSTCSVQECANSCNDTDVKASASNAVTNLNFATKSFTAFSVHVQPLMDCGTLLDQAFGPLVVCDDFRDSFLTLGFGAMTYTIFFAVGICLIFRAQKRFFKPPKTEEELAQEQEELEVPGHEFTDLTKPVRKVRRVRVANEPLESGEAQAHAEPAQGKKAVVEGQ